jgi:RNA polymerase nonessential primary-like sigma factor
MGYYYYKHAALLTKDEEFRLFKAFRKNNLNGKFNKEIFDKLILSNLRLVIKIAKSYKECFPGMKADMDDLIQEGTLGLMLAVNRFDCEFISKNRKVKFATYASHYIKMSLRSYIINKIPTIRIPCHLYNKKMLEHPSPNQKILIDKSHIKKRCLSNSISNNIINKENDLDDVIDSRHINLEVLEEREKIVIEERFLNGDTITLAALGRRLGLSRERVRQIQDEALLKLRTIY